MLRGKKDKAEVKSFVLFGFGLFSQILITEIDFRWPLATKSLAYLNEAALKCGFHIIVAPSPNSDEELVVQRLTQAFKRKAQKIEIIQKLPAFLPVNRTANYVMSPIYVLETASEIGSSKTVRLEVESQKPVPNSENFGEASGFETVPEREVEVRGCFSFHELNRFCEPSSLREKLKSEQFDISQCREKIFEGPIDNTFKFFYLMVMFLLLSLTLLIAFFW